MQDANAAELVETLKWMNVKVKPYGQNETRQAKIKRVINYCHDNNKTINIRACWKDDKAKNCCKCEKCYRTMVGIAVEGENPQNYGFDVGKCFLLTIGIRLKNILKRETREHEREMLCCFWADIQRHYRGNIWYLNWLKRLSCRGKG